MAREYEVTVYETNSYKVKVKAESVEDATEKVEKLYDLGLCLPFVGSDEWSKLDIVSVVDNPLECETTFNCV